MFDLLQTPRQAVSFLTSPQESPLVIKLTDLDLDAILRFCSPAPFGDLLTELTRLDASVRRGSEARFTMTRSSSSVVGTPCFYCLSVKANWCPPLGSRLVRPCSSSGCHLSMIICSLQVRLRQRRTVVRVASEAGSIIPHLSSS